MIPQLTYSLILSLTFIISAHASIGPIANLTIANANISPDGFTRPAVLAGGTHPGPVITGKKGDTFRINVTDALTDESMLTATSIHWHGLNMKKANWADGPTFVNQCPISPGHSFVYEFNVTDQAGTFWYHSHHVTQYCDGLRGALIIYDPDDPYAYLYDVDDESTIITLSDWYHVPGPSAGSHPPSDAVLINGLGRYSGGPANPLSVVNVVYGKRYRFRLIAMSCDANFVFSIDGHDMTIIEADGVNTELLTVNSIQIFPGQRYSFILNAFQPVDNYWIRANPSSGTTGFSDGLNMAILRYAGAADTDPTTGTDGGANFLVPLVETDLHTLENPGAPGEPTLDGADVSITMSLGYNYTQEVFTVNGESLVSPTVPVLLQILSGTSDAASLMPAGSIYTLPPNKVIQISFLPGNAPGGPHPMHLHGHTFDVIRSANSSVYNYLNPVRRDTVSTGYEGDNTTIRFRTDNSGPWILHCHIDRHTAAGLGVIMVEDVAGISNGGGIGSVPESWDELCPIYDAQASEQVVTGGSTVASSLSSPSSSPSSPSSSSSSKRHDSEGGSHRHLHRQDFQMNHHVF